MKKKAVIVVLLTAVLLVSTAAVAMARGRGHSDLAQVRAATARFHRVQAAEAAGYVLPPDSPCVAHPELGGMGYHFANFDLVDLELDPVKPEVLLYAPGPGGTLRLVGVEYVVPIAAWDAQGHDHPPMVLGQHLHRNEFLGLYALHAWVWRHNPAGMFADFNPNVFCDG